MRAVDLRGHGVGAALPDPGGLADDQVRLVTRGDQLVQADDRFGNPAAQAE
jgi:hypothetical protein